MPGGLGWLTRAIAGVGQGSWGIPCRGSSGGVTRAEVGMGQGGLRVFCAEGTLT